MTKFRLKEIAENNIELDKICGKFSGRVENAVIKGEIALYEQFILFPQCFRDLYRRHVKNKGL